MKKIIGYIILAVGLILILVSIASPKLTIPVLTPLIIQFNTFYVSIVGFVIAVAGAFLAFQNSEKQKSKEVPIYKGKEIVGYRREK